jgi:photosynthetic reaction center H subunit
MQTGAIVGNIDVAQMVFTGFVLFFVGLIIYLQRESNREGFPLRDNEGRIVNWQGVNGVPSPKKFHLPEGGVVYAPALTVPDVIPVRGIKTAEFLGAPLEPTGNKLLSGLGPAAYNEDRIDEPAYTYFGDRNPRIVPLAADPHHSLSLQGPDPRGYVVVGADRVVGGTISDVWFDRSEAFIRYYEVLTTPELGGRKVLVPAPLADVQPTNKKVVVPSILGAQFKDVPGTKSPVQVTLLEEDRLSGYYGGGTLYATPQRSEPLI